MTLYLSAEIRGTWYTSLSGVGVAVGPNFPVLTVVIRTTLAYLHMAI